MIAVLSVTFSCMGCGSNDPNRPAQIELERNRKKLSEIQKSLSAAKDESVALTTKIEKLSNEVSALQGSSNEKKP